MTPDEAYAVALKDTLHGGVGIVRPRAIIPATFAGQGVTQTTYNSYRTSREFPWRSVRYIGSEELADIYKGYWTTPQLDRAREIAEEIVPKDITKSTFSDEDGDTWEVWKNDGKWHSKLHRGLQEVNEFISLAKTDASAHMDDTTFIRILKEQGAL